MVDQPGGAAATDAAADGGGATTDRFGAGGRRRIFLMYGGILLVAIVLVDLMIRVGRGIDAPKPAGDTGQAKEAFDTHQIIWKLLLAAAVIIVVSRLVGALFRRINQPQVVGEIVAGIMLGPSLLGAL